MTDKQKTSIEARLRYAQRMCEKADDRLAKAIEAGMPEDEIARRKKTVVRFDNYLKGMEEVLRLLGYSYVNEYDEEDNIAACRLYHLSDGRPGAYTVYLNL